MIVESVLGNIAELSAEELAEVHVETVTLPSDALRRRVQRVVSDHGREFGVRLAGADQLRVGDILLRDAHCVVVVAVETSDVLVIAPATVEQMGRVAHNLGNRHMPAQFFGPGDLFAGADAHEALMVIPYDHTAEHLLRELSVPHRRADTVLPVPFRHAEHTH